MTTVYKIRGTPKEWTESEERTLRYRVSVSTTSKGVKSFDCTVEGSGYVMADILEKSDALVAELEKRYTVKEGE